MNKLLKRYIQRPAVSTSLLKRINRESLGNFLRTYLSNPNNNPFTEDEAKFITHCLTMRAKCYSGFGQDAWVLYETGVKRGGYFVEFGATDGVWLSNTYALESQFGWSGIVAEPNPAWHPALHANRRCTIDTRCVYDATGQTVKFRVTRNADIGTIDAFTDRDMHAQMRSDSQVIDVGTVSLNDLLVQSKAPATIDYLSIDTEGSEFAILSAFDFARFDVRLITVEHNYTADRGRIHELLRGKGYVRKLEGISQNDDWYVKQ